MKSYRVGSIGIILDTALNAGCGVGFNFNVYPYSWATVKGTIEFQLGCWAVEFSWSK